MANQRFLIRTKMCEALQRLRIGILAGALLAFGLQLSGCSTATTFRVLDAETKKPVEGAVALATWGGSRRMAIIAGPTFGYTAKAVEAVSDKDGYLTIPGATGEIAFNPPLLQIYKPTYVGWNSQEVYLGFAPYDRNHPLTKKRENFIWKSQDIYLQPWKDDGTMNHYSHSSFVMPDGDIYRGGIKESIYDKAIDYEIMKKRHERSLVKEHE